MAGNMAVCGYAGNLFQVGTLLPVRFSGQAVVAGNCNTLPIFRGGGFTCVSRGAGYAWRDEKTKIRAGRVRPAVVEFWRGRQEADLQGKKRKHGRLRFFLPLGPRLRPGAAPPPLSR